MTTRLSLPSSTLLITSSWQVRNVLKPQYLLSTACALCGAAVACMALGSASLLAATLGTSR